MSAIQSLENAILERIKKQEVFKKDVKAALIRAFNSLPECDSKDEVSTTINMNKDKFASLLEKLHNDKSLNREAVQQLIQSTNIKDLKKGNSDLRLSDSYHTANGSLSGFSGSSPRPSDLDGLRFSDDSRSSYLTANNSSNSVPVYPIVKPTIENGSEEFNFNQPPKPSGGKRTRRR